MKTKEVSRLRWYNKSSSALLAIVSVALAYVVGLRAIDTGSLQQYFIGIILIAFAINRIARIVSSARSQKRKAL